MRQEYDQWLYDVMQLAIDDDWDYMTKWYSFSSAYDEGMTPRQAYYDCILWLYDRTGQVGLQHR